MNVRASRALLLLSTLCIGCSMGEDQKRYSAQFGEVQTDMERRVIHVDSRPIPIYFGDAKSEAGTTYSNHPKASDLLLNTDQLKVKQSFEKAAVYVALADNPIKYKIIVGSAFQGMPAKDASYVICGKRDTAEPTYFIVTINYNQLRNINTLLQEIVKSR